MAPVASSEIREPPVSCAGVEKVTPPSTERVNPVAWLLLPLLAQITLMLPVASTAICGEQGSNVRQEGSDGAGPISIGDEKVIPASVDRLKKICGALETGVSPQ